MKLKRIYTTVICLMGLLSMSTLAQKADLKKVTNNLDMDGHYFMANNIEGDLGKIANLGNDWLKTAVQNGKNVPKGLNFNTMLGELGVDQIYAYGRSAKFAGDHWVSKMFVQTNGSNKGLHSLIGRKAAPFAVAQFAPAGSDLALETQLNLRQVSRMMQLLKNSDCPKAQKMLSHLDRKLPSGKMTAGQLMNKLNLKLSIVAKLDDKKRKVCPVHPEYTFPEIHFCGRIQGANALLNEVMPMAGFMFKMQNNEDGTVLMTPRKMPKRGPMKDKKPVMLYDQKQNILWMASSIEFLGECRGNGPKLNDDAQFKAISGGVMSGNALAYISKQTCMEIRQVKEAKYKKRGKKKLSDPMIKKIMDHLTESKNGYIAMIVRNNNGVQFILKAPCPAKDIMACGKRRGKCGYSKGCSKRKKGCKKSGCKKGGCSKGGCSKGGCSKGGCSKGGCSKGGCSKGGCSKGGCSKGGCSKGGCSKGGCSKGGCSKGGCSKGGCSKGGCSKGGCSKGGCKKGGCKKGKCTKGCKGCSKCKKGNGSCPYSGKGNKGDKKPACKCPKGKCGCAKDKAGCKCPAGTCECGKKKPKGSKDPMKKPNSKPKKPKAQPAQPQSDWDCDCPKGKCDCGKSSI